MGAQIGAGGLRTGGGPQTLNNGMSSRLFILFIYLNYYCQIKCSHHVDVEMNEKDDVNEKK